MNYLQIQKNYLVPKDKKLRRNFFKSELYRKFYRALFTDQRLPWKIRLMVFRKLAKKHKKSSVTRIRNRCILTGRARGVYRVFHMARFQFKQLADLGFLTGIERTSW